MFLEIHDNEPPTLVGAAHRLDHIYQAEMWIADTLSDERNVRWVLFTTEGKPLVQWRRTGPDAFEQVPVEPGLAPDPRALACAKEKEAEDERRRLERDRKATEP